MVGVAVVGASLAPMVAMPVASTSLAPLGLDSFSENCSTPSFAVSSVIATVTVLATSPAAKARVPEAAT